MIKNGRRLSRDHFWFITWHVWFIYSKCIITILEQYSNAFLNKKNQRKKGGRLEPWSIVMMPKCRHALESIIIGSHQFNSHCWIIKIEKIIKKKLSKLNCHLEHSREIIKRSVKNNFSLDCFVMNLYRYARGYQIKSHFNY